MGHTTWGKGLWYLRSLLQHLLQLQHPKTENAFSGFHLLITIIPVLLHPSRQTASSIRWHPQCGGPQ